ncbi:hypothetical protein ACF3M1_16725 [Luteimonas sp. WGS1318]|uniref:hypothetical protein n=1 Tax=Luteimonas sp. WGS1318 TaxID=3366815 RepID=UPI00372D4C15
MQHQQGGVSAYPEQKQSTSSIWANCRRDVIVYKLGHTQNPVMHRFLTRFGRSMAALLIAVMVIAPLSDALACAVESNAPHSVEAVVPDAMSADACEEAGGGDRVHAACAHNHCHHSSANVTGALSAVPDAFMCSQALRFEDGRRFRDFSDSLLRPPKV